MNFFAAQERARKETRKLVIWFALCLMGVVATMYAFIIIARNVSGFDARLLDGGPQAIQWWQPQWFLWTFLIVGGVILIGSLVKLTQLSAGGNVVAQSLGGRQVDPSTKDLKERRLLHIVEEMSIASGAPVPDVWIMDNEEGINAFAAGTDPANAVIGVTRGTLEHLTRAELQGVIAHEFSHILNGDMKLNMRLMGWIFGLVMISVVGRLLIESIRFMRGSRNSKGNGAILGIVLLGVAVWIIGSIGVLFARMLQAAISRQREFLADASAVQFTRHPEGITGALKKIGGFSGHGKINAAKAAEARHMFFAPSALSSMLATHPPLEERIKAIEPNWKGEMLEGMADPVSPAEFKGAMGFSDGRGATPPPVPSTGAGALEQLGDRQQPDSSAGPSDLHEFPSSDPTTMTKEGAKAQLLGMLIPVEQQDIGRNTMTGHGLELELIDTAIMRSSQLAGISTRMKLELLDHSLPWLRKMSPSEARELVAACQALVTADGQIDLFEFMLLQVIRRHIEIGLGLQTVPKIRHRRIAQLSDEVAELLSLFANIAGDRSALEPAIAEFREHTSDTLNPPESPDFDKVSKALPEMDAATPIVKQQILRLCSLVATHDKQVDGNELQLLRATAESMGCQIPPMAREVA